MPGLTYPGPDSPNELNDTHNDQQPHSEDSEDYATDAADASTQLEELHPDDFPTYFLEHDGRLFASSFTPYPFPVDTPEQEVRHQCCPSRIMTSL